VYGSFPERAAMLGHLVSNAFSHGIDRRPPGGLFHGFWKFLFRR